MYTETYFVLCTGLRLQPTVYYVGLSVDCSDIQ